MRKRFFASLVAVLFIVSGATSMTTAYAVTLPPNEPAHGLIIQVSSLAPTVPPTTLRTWLNTIRSYHRDKLKPGYIDTVVLQDIADQNGKLITPYLDVLAPYLPGGATPAFDQAFIGTVDLAWTGSGSKYIEGIEDPAFRSKNVTLSSTAAKAFKARYPRAATNWYIGYEANLSGFWDSAIETSYATYINQLVLALSSVSPGKTYLWSPAFWTPYRNEPAWALPSLQANLVDLASKIKLPFTVDVQDFVGQSGGASTKEDAATWINYLKANWKSASVSWPLTFETNAEQFIQNANGAISVGNATEIPTRENYYVQQGIKLGAAWEIRYWHQRLYGN